MYKVLHVFTSLDRGGAETFVMNVYRNIDRKKVNFDFVVQTDSIGSYEKEIEYLGGKIYRLPSRNKGIKNHKVAWNNFFEKYNEYNAVHFHRSCLSGIYPIKVARKKGIKNIIVHSHNTSVDELHHRLMHYINKQVVYKYADNFLACSDKAARWLYNKDALERVYIIKNGIDAEKFRYNKKIRQNIREKEGLNGKFVIGHVGRFVNAKNHDMLIDIFKEIKQIKSNAILYLVGQGELLEDIKDKVRQNGLTESVIFAGIRSNIHELMQGMDIFLFPSLYEGLPVTLIEAQASGLKCLVSEEVSNEVALTDLVKFLSIKNGIDKWVDSIVIEELYERSDTYNQITQNGYNIHGVVKQLEQIYLGV